MLPFNKLLHGWQLKLGPLTIRGDIHDPTHREIINYYWRDKFFLCSQRKKLIVIIKGRRYIWMYFNRKIHHKSEPYATT